MAFRVLLLVCFAALLISAMCASAALSEGCVDAQEKCWSTKLNCPCDRLLPASCSGAGVRGSSVDRSALCKCGLDGVECYRRNKCDRHPALTVYRMLKLHCTRAKDLKEAEPPAGFPNDQDR